MSDLKNFDNTNIAFSYKSDYELKRAYYLFKLLSFPLLATIGKYSLKFLLSINFPIGFIIKRTVFAQFCGGEDEMDCFKVINKLRDNNISCILNYSVEGSSTEIDFDKTLDRTINLIELIKENSLTSFIVFKPSAVGRFDLYLKKSNNENLNVEEIEEWKRIENRFDSICSAAKANSIAVLIDAEESWIQSSVDELIEKLTIKYNSSACIVYNTIQAYRKDRLQYLKNMHERLLKLDVKIGVKLVRGAYMEKERLRSKSKNYESPICQTKLKTDENFNSCMKYILGNIDKFNLFIGSHNEESNLIATQLMKQFNVQNDDRRIWFSQLYGMSDHISFNLALNGFNVTKYLPFGPVKEVIPYLIRRLDENTSVSGQTSRELNLINKEIKRRKSV